MALTEKLGRYKIVDNDQTAAELINPLAPNDPYMGRTAPLTSRRCILNIYSTNIRTEYFKRAAYLRFFSSSKCCLFHNATLFGSCIIHIIKKGCVLKFKRKFRCQRVNHACALLLYQIQYSFFWNVLLYMPPLPSKRRGRGLSFRIWCSSFCLSAVCGASMSHLPSAFSATLPPWQTLQLVIRASASIPSHPCHSVVWACVFLFTYEEQELLQIFFWSQCLLLQGLVKVMAPFFQERAMSHAGCVSQLTAQYWHQHVQLSLLCAWCYSCMQHGWFLWQLSCYVYW